MTKYALAPLLALMMSLATPVTASAKEKTFDLNAEIAFEIPAQSLESALLELSKQAAFQLVISSGSLPKQEVASISGKMPIKQALDRLLRDTDLNYRWVGEHTVTVTPRSAAPARSSAAAEEASAIVVAQAQDDDAAKQDDEAQQTISSDIQKESQQGIPEMLVQGKRSINTDIERTKDDIQPYIVFSEKQIQHSMSANISEFLTTRLTMGGGAFIARSTSDVGGGNASGISLRGLGSNQTLILINGRRLPGMSTSQTYNQFSSQGDINGIPITSVERIEVLPSTAGGIYGGSATGGVINIILKKDYTGVMAKASYDTPFDTDAARTRFDLSGGFALEGGKTHVTLSTSYSQQNDLLARDRDFAREGRAKQMHFNPGVITDGFYPIFGYTTNICSADTLGFDACSKATIPYGGTEVPLVLKYNNTPLGSSITSIPVGYAGISSDNGLKLLENAGHYNLGLPDDLYGGRSVLNGGPTTSALSVNITRAMNEHIDVFVDGSMYVNKVRVVSASIVTPNYRAVNQFKLAETAPNNPFTTPIIVSVPVPGLDGLKDWESKNWRALGGVKMRLPFQWHGEADYEWSRSRQFIAYTDPMFSASSNIDAALTNGVLDVMRDVNANPLDYSPYLLPPLNNRYGPADMVMTDVRLQLAGPTLRLPAGPVNVSALFERRKEESLASTHTGIESSGESYRAYFYPKSQTVTSLYLESQVPLLGPGNALPLVRELQMQLSVRRDGYQTRGLPRNTPQVPGLEVHYVTNEVTAAKQTLGLRYVPVEDVALRVSYGTGFLPPAVEQVAPATFNNINYSYYLDPKRGNTGIGIITLSQEGNDQLLPEDSKSLSAGVIFTPRLLPGFRFSVDYTKIDKTNEIGSMGTNQLLLYEELFQDRVERAPLTPADTALGYTGGAITAVHEGPVNFARAKVEAVDFQADYHWDMQSYGAFSVFALSTRQIKFERQIRLEVPSLNTVGFSDGPTRVRITGGLTWDKGPWGAGWNFNYSGKSLMYASSQASDPAFWENYYRVRQGTFIRRNKATNDAFFRYQFSERPLFAAPVLANTELMIGIKNVFNQYYVLASTSATGNDGSLAGPNLRSYSITVTKQW